MVWGVDWCQLWDVVYTNIVMARRSGEKLDYYYIEWTLVISHLSCIEHIFPQCSVVFMSPFPAQQEKFDRMDIKFCHLSYIKTSSPLYSIHYSPTPAQRLGLHSEGQMSLSGEELDKMDLGHLSRIINKVDVFYRVTPRNKVKIVKVRADIVLKC